MRDPSEAETGRLPPKSPPFDAAFRLPTKPREFAARSVAGFKTVEDLGCRGFGGMGKLHRRRWQRQADLAVKQDFDDTTAPFLG